MEGLAGVLLVVALAGGGYVLHAVEARARTRSWRALAQRCGVCDIEVSSFLGVPHEVRGRSGSFRIGLCDYQRGKQERGTRLSVVPEDRFHVTLRPETLGTALEKRLIGTREIEVGDQAFDQAFFVGGAPARGRALLDALTRDVLMRLCAVARVELWSYELLVYVPESEQIGRGVLPECVLELALDAARRLSGPVDVGERLADNVCHDPVTDVRLENLHLLIREFPEHPAARVALLTACRDASAEVRLHAGRALGEEGRETLLALAEDDRVGDACAARAVAGLGRHLPFERAQALFERARRARRLATARACLEVLGAAREESAQALLVKVLALESSDLAVLAARLLGASGAASVEGPLLAALTRDVPGLRPALAEALGRAGSAAAVLPLKEAAARHARDREFTRAARQAIARIQSRLGGAAPGQLSLASAEAGQLSLADDETGRLSFPPGEAGQVSFPSGEAGQLSLPDGG